MYIYTNNLGKKIKDHSSLGKVVPELVKKKKFKLLFLYIYLYYFI